MRTPKLLAGLFLTLALVAGGYAQSVPQMLKDGQVAYMKGDVETAKKNFEMVLQKEPRNATAHGYLRMIHANPKASPGNTVQKQSESLIMPKVEFRDATFGSALDFVKQAAAKQTDGKLVLNFVVQLPEEQVKTRKLTLSLTNIPLAEVLKYIGSLTDSEFEYEKHAIVVRPKTAPTASTLPAPGN
ncbi:MAG: hypothetical protein M3463_15765 [Verrucomicrobiota bacterium]|nr:hypothetical protein [Verrucomicrobiota bacterium]